MKIAFELVPLIYPFILRQHSNLIKSRSHSINIVSLKVGVYYHDGEVFDESTLAFVAVVFVELVECDFKCLDNCIFEGNVFRQSRHSRPLLFKWLMLLQPPPPLPALLSSANPSM